MPAVPSTMLELGTVAPDFTLPDMNGRSVAVEDLTGSEALLVMFICNHCPYVKHVERELAAVASEYAPRGVAVVGVMPNDTGRYPDDGPDGMRAQARRAGFEFPYLIDDSQQVARAYQAACTPDFFLFDSDRRLVYRGQLDDSRPGNATAVTGADLRAALDALLGGRPVPEEQRPSIGCSIKWKA